MLRFGALMLRAGHAAFRVRDWMGAVAGSLGIEALAVHLTLGGMTATARRRGPHLAIEIAPLGMFRRRLNQLAVTAICTVIASGAYCLIAAVLGAFGFPAPHQGAGLISSVLFLVPGFPLVTALLGKVQRQTVAGVARLTCGGLIMVAAAFGLTLVAAAAGLTAQAPPPLPLGEVATSLLRGVASAARWLSAWRWPVS